MKKYLALLLALVMCFALVACGNNSEPKTPVDDNPPATDPSVEPADPADNGDDAEAADWNDFADVFTVAYAGLTEAGESVIFVMDDEPTFGALVIADTEEIASVSFVGEMTAVETDTGFGYTITDETNGLSLTFDVVANEDGTITLDAGDLGTMTIESCDVATALDTLNIVDAAYAPVA